MMNKWLFITIILVGFWLNHTGDDYADAATGIASQHKEKVILYATDWCSYCEKTRSFLERKNIPYKEYDIEKSSRGRSHYEKLGGTGVPLLIVNDAVVRGYNTQVITSRLTD